MKYIKEYNRYNESFIADVLSNFILTLGLMYGYNSVKEFIKLKRFDMAQKNLSGIINKIESNTEIEELFDKLADLVEDGLKDSDEFKTLSNEIKNRLEEYLTTEEYNKWL